VLSELNSPVPSASEGGGRLRARICLLFTFWRCDICARQRPPRQIYSGSVETHKFPLVHVSVHRQKIVRVKPQPPSKRLTRAMTNNLRYAFTKFFRAYYKTLRREIDQAVEAGADPDSMPHYYKGYKKVQTIVCSDGVVVVHFPADDGATRDGFEFYLSLDYDVKTMADRYNQPLPGGNKMEPLIDYQPGESFYRVYSEPRQRRTPFDSEGRELVQEDKWHRLDMVSLSRLETYYDEREAKRQAKEIFATRDQRRGSQAERKYGGVSKVSGALSEDPTDRLIREIIRTKQPASPEEIDRILERVSGATFMGEVKVPPRHRGLEYQGRAVGAKDESLFYHLARRVDEGQWANGTTEEEYLQDLRNAASDPSPRLVLYTLRGGNMAAVFSDNTVPRERLGPDSLDHLFVVYSADRGKIVSGYQVSGLGEVNVSGNPLWLQ
jgi:hypothetical protein